MREIRTSGLMRGEAAKTPPLLDWLKETAKETARRSSLDLRAGSVSARSWGERVTTEHTGHTEKRVEG
jgi:hypothetical protein